MPQLCMVSTLFGGAGLAAAIDEGLLSEPVDGERILLVSNNAVAMELVTPWHELPIAAHIVSRFSRVLYLNELLYPYHPSAWKPRLDDVFLLERLLRRYWDLGHGPVDLIVDSLHVPPAAALASIFRSGTISVLSEGLMSYGPTRFLQPLHVSQRLGQLVYVDLLPELKPLLLSENDIPLTPVPAEAFRRVFDEMESLTEEADALPGHDSIPTALVLGQYLSALNVLTSEEEVRLYLDMVDRAVEGGARRVIFKPHPSSPPALPDRMRHEAAEKGAEFLLLESDLPAELVGASIRPMTTVSCFSTALVTLSRLYALPVISVGCELLLERLTPYQNSNRVPVTIVDAITREDPRYRQGTGLQDLLDTVSYCMRSGTGLEHLRDRVEGFLETLPDAERRRYVKRRRLTALGLPGAVASATVVPRPRRSRRERFLRAPLRWARSMANRR